MLTDASIIAPTAGTLRILFHIQALHYTSVDMILRHSEQGVCSESIAIAREVAGMRKIYVLIAALVVAIAVALGAYAATLATALGPTSPSTKNMSTVVAQTNQRLSAANAAIATALAQRPPSLNGGRVPFVAPHPVVVNVSGTANAVPYTAPVGHFGDDGGEHGD
jgi:hypothetical protein